MDEDFTPEELMRQGEAPVGKAGAAREPFPRLAQPHLMSAESGVGREGPAEEMCPERADCDGAEDLRADNAETESDAQSIETAGGRASAEAATAETVYCTYHPQVQTALRCNRCGEPICPKCAVLTEVGYRCRDCIRSQQSVFFNIRSMDYPVALFVGGVVACLAAILLVQGGFFVCLLLSPVTGGLIGELARSAIGRRRGRYIWLAVGSAVIVGGLLGFAISGLLLGPPNPITLLLFLVLATGTAAGRLR